MTATYSLPGDEYVEWIGVAGAADDTLIHTSGDVSGFNYHTIAVTGTDSADVEVTIDGIIWYLVSVFLVDDVSKGGKAVNTIPSGSLGVLRLKCKQIRIRQDGNTDANAFGAHGIV